jgi:hypothetical protein
MAELKNTYYGAETTICMFFGGFKRIDEIVKGDIILDDKFYPNIVMGVHNDVRRLISINIASETFRVAQDGYLETYNEATYSEKTMSIENIANLESHWRDQYKIRLTPVEYRKQITKNDPYLIGLVAGSKNNLTTVIREFFIYRVNRLDDNVRNRKNIDFSQIDKEELKTMIKNREIPAEYIFNDKATRFNLLQGFIHSRKTTSVKRARSAEKKKPVRSLHSRSKSLVRKPVRSSSDLRKFIPSSIVASTRSQSEQDSDEEKSDTSFQKSIVSRIPILRKKELIYEIKDPIIGEQMKILVKSLGFDCIYLDGELVIYSNQSELTRMPQFRQYTKSFKIAPSKEELAYRLIFDSNKKIILSNYVICG